MTRETLRHPALMALALVLLVLAVFGHAALTSGFLMDDSRFITDNPRLTEEGAVLRALVDPELIERGGGRGIVRPLRTAEFALDAQLGGSAAIYHLHSLAWHALASVLLFFLLRALTGRAGPALVGAAIWAVHPMQVESVAWVASRGDVAMGGCVFSALLLALRSRGWDRYLGLSLGLSFLAMAYKETAIVMPLLVFAVRLARPVGATRGIAAALRSAWPWVIVSIAYWFYRETLRVGMLSHTMYELGGGVAGTFATMFKGFAAYIGFALLPVQPAHDWYMPISSSLTDPAALLCLGVHVSLVVVAVRSVRRAPLLAAGICVFYFALLPVSNWPFRIGIPTAERFLYVPLAGLAIVVAAGYARVARHARHGAIAVSLVVLGMGAISYSTARVWRDRDASMEAALALGHSPRALTARAIELAQRGWDLRRAARATANTEDARELDEASRRELSRALDTAARARARWLDWAPVANVEGHPVHQADAAAAYAALGLDRFDDALRLADRALALTSRASRAHYTRAWCLLEKGRPDEAVAAMLDAERNDLPLVDEEFVVFFGRAARAFAREGRVELARDAYRKALDLGIEGRAADAVRRELRALEGG